MVTAAAAWKQTSDKILNLITSRRMRLNVEAPQIWAIRRAVAGVTHNRGLKETRGRKKKLTKVQVNRLFTKRKEMVQKADKQYNVSYDMVSTAARVPEVHRTTTARYLGSKGVKWRRMREKAARTEAHEEHASMLTAFCVRGQSRSGRRTFIACTCRAPHKDIYMI